MRHSSVGDPEGHRLSKRKANLLAEARLVARSLEVLLERAGHDSSQCSQLIQQLAEEEAIQLMRARGRVESRKRFKGHAAQPLLDKRVAKFLYLDESGKSFPEPDLPGQRCFALGAVAMSQAEEDDYCMRADEIKREFFGRTDITFHEPNMRERDGPYYFDGNKDRQLEFDEAISGLLGTAAYMAFGTGVRKSAFKEDFLEAGVDPYLPTDAYALAIMLLLERFIDYLATQPTKFIGRLVFESQGPLEDAQHQFQYTLVLLDGSQWVPESAFRNWLEAGCHFIPKSGSNPTELSDVVSREIFEWIRGDCLVTPKFWNVIGPKFYCRDDGMVGKFGLKVFPDSDVREAVEAHRRGVIA